jgi:hypothetical protein
MRRRVVKKGTITTSGMGGIIITATRDSMTAVIIEGGVRRSLGRIHYIIIVLWRKTVMRVKMRVNARRKGGLVGCWIGFERCVASAF